MPQIVRNPIYKNFGNFEVTQVECFGSRSNGFLKEFIRYFRIFFSNLFILFLLVLVNDDDYFVCSIPSSWFFFCILISARTLQFATELLL